jgi:hypothetical protein
MGAVRNAYIILIRQGWEDNIKMDLQRHRLEGANWIEELEQVYDQFPRYHMKILLGDFNAKVGTEDLFKPILGNEIRLTD